MKVYSPALALGLIAPILSIHAETSNSNNKDSPARMQRLTRRNAVDLSSSKSGSSTFARRNATTFVPRQDKVDSTVSNSTTSASSIGDVVDKHLQQSESSGHGSPYLVANALRLFHEGIVLPAKKAQVVKRGEENDQNITPTVTAGDDQDDEECEEEDGDDAEECDGDEAEDPEERDDDGEDDDEEDCEDEDGDTSPISDGGNASFVTIDTPANLAEGSLTGKDGCTKFATAVTGDSCYILIGARDDALLKIFYKNNPSVDAEGQNLEVDSAYCISAADASTSTSAPVESSSPTAAPSPTPSAPTESKVIAVETPADSKPSPEPQQNDVVPSVNLDVQLEASVTQPKAAEPTQKSDNNKKGSGKKADYAGTATYYFQYGNAGACGKIRGDSDYIVALPPSLYNNGARCDQKLSITNKSTGKTVQAEVMDLCPTCADQSNNRQIDLSKGLFDAISNGADGTFQVEYGFL